MRTYIVSSLALSLGFAFATPASAQDAASDVRCILVSNVFSRVEPDVKKKAVAQATGLYFSGRVSARMSPAQIKAQIVAQAKGLNKDNSGPVMTACAKYLQENQRMMQGVALEIQKANPAPPSAKK